MSSQKTETLAMFLGTRQKRLSYWREAFAEHSLAPEQAKQVQDLLANYNLWIAKATKAKSEESELEARNSLLAIERELTSLFEMRRLRTSTLSPTDRSATVLMKPRHAVTSENH